MSFREIVPPKELEQDAILVDGKLVLRLRNCNLQFKQIAVLKKLANSRVQTIRLAARYELIARSPSCPDCRGTGSIYHNFQHRLCNRCNGKGVRLA